MGGFVTELEDFFDENKSDILSIFGFFGSVSSTIEDLVTLEEKTDMNDISILLNILKIYRLSRERKDMLISILGLDEVLLNTFSSVLESVMEESGLTFEDLIGNNLDFDFDLDIDLLDFEEGDLDLKIDELPFDFSEDGGSLLIDYENIFAKFMLVFGENFKSDFDLTKFKEVLSESESIIDFLGNISDYVVIDENLSFTDAVAGGNMFAIIAMITREFREKLEEFFNAVIYDDAYFLEKIIVRNFFLQDDVYTPLSGNNIHSLENEITIFEYFNINITYDRFQIVSSGVKGEFGISNFSNVDVVLDIEKFSSVKHNILDTFKHNYLLIGGDTKENGSFIDGLQFVESVVNLNESVFNKQETKEFDYIKSCDINLKMDFENVALYYLDRNYPDEWLLVPNGNLAIKLFQKGGSFTRYYEVDLNKKDLLKDIFSKSVNDNILFSGVATYLNEENSDSINTNSFEVLDFSCVGANLKGLEFSDYLNNFDSEDYETFLNSESYLYFIEFLRLKESKILNISEVSVGSYNTEIVESTPSLNYDYGNITRNFSLYFYLNKSYIDEFFNSSQDFIEQNMSKGYTEITDSMIDYSSEIIDFYEDLF